MTNIANVPAPAEIPATTPAWSLEDTLEAAPAAVRTARTGLMDHGATDGDAHQQHQGTPTGTPTTTVTAPRE